jgi:hypothetical protein
VEELITYQKFKITGKKEERILGSQLAGEGENCLAGNLTLLEGIGVGSSNLAVFERPL